MRKLLILTSIILATAFSCTTIDNTVETADLTGITELGIIPAPTSVTLHKGVHPLSLRNPIIIKNEKIPSEGYNISITPTEIRITHCDEAGLFYANQTIDQMLKAKSAVESIKCMTITDSPRYSWRGLMLDESRHFFGIEKVKEILDDMAKLKLNRFHWHLTDSNGWRIEIPGYPKLTEVGGIGNYTDPNALAEFYTIEEIKEIVAYAAERHIIVVPEIDMPGHATAAANAYPHLSGGGNEKYPNFTFNPGSEAVYDFLTDVLTEITKLFPSPWIHFGGDEVHFANAQWIDIPEVQALMKKEKLRNLKEVEYYFNNRMAKVINDLGKTVIGWDEVVNAGLDPEKSAIIWWRHDQIKSVNTALKKGFPTILAPRLPCYFDFDQDESHQYGRKWEGFASSEGLHGFPENLQVNLAGEPAQNILGIQACIWTEQIASEKRLNYMTYPRIYALAESAWSRPHNKNFENYKLRLAPYLQELKEKGIYYYDLFAPETTPEPTANEQ